MRRLVVVAMALAIIQQVSAMPLSPESVASLRASGKFAEVAAREAEMRSRGMDAPRPNHLSALRAQRRDDADETVFKLPIILVDFNDNRANRNTHPVEYYERQCFSEGELEQGSGREWFRENSYGELRFEGQVADWVRAPEDYGYYVDGRNGGGDYPNNVMGLTEDAVHLVDDQVDFSDFDNDGDGEVETVVIVHAGGGAEANGGDQNMIWSMAWVIWGQDVVLDGVRIYSFFTIPEEAGVGVVCHEASHAFFGLPDLYDRDYTSSGVGMWSMMAAGSWGGGGARPVHWDGWCKKQIGMTNPTVLRANEAQVSIPPIETDDASYVLWNQGNVAREYFLIENRQPIGFDQSLPASGLVIYHVDESVRGQNDNEWYPGHQDDGHYEVAVEQADGDWALERDANSGDDGDPFPGSSENHNFGDQTTPNSRGYRNNAQTRVAVRSIQIQNRNVICDLEVGVAADGPDIATDPGAVEFGDVAVNTEVDSIIYVMNTGNRRLDVTNFSITGEYADHFQVVNGDAFSLEPAEVIDVTIRFAPMIAGELTASLWIESNDPDENPREVTLSGIAFGTPYITSPSDLADFRVTLSAIDTMDLAFRAVDPEGGALTWEMSNRGHLPNGVELTENEGASARLYWPRPTVGRYAPVCTVTDPEGESDQIRLFITITIANQLPVFGNFNPIEIDEDAARTTIAKADTLFTDEEGDSLSFALGNVPAELSVRLSEDGFISIEPAHNFNSVDGVRFGIIATDPSNRSVPGELVVKVKAMNDAPSQAMLSFPSDGIELVRLDESFRWNHSTDIDGDLVNYTLKLALSIEPVAILTQSIGNDTTGIFTGLTNQYLESIGVSGEVNGSWWVEASDGVASTESAHRTIRVKPLGVTSGSPNWPEKCQISDGYPNPFNSSIRIQYSLAYNARVKIAVYTLSGSLANTLVDGIESAGVHSATWDGRNSTGSELPGGIYLIHSTAGSAQKTIKAVLVR